jgi:hypothetical protein
MERLPNDILRLILSKYLPPMDTIKCFLHIKLFHNACNEHTLTLIKKKYFTFLATQYYYEPSTSINTDNYVACTCTQIIRKENANRHRRKCLKCLSIFPLPQNCPECNKELYKFYEFSGTTYCDLYHLKKYCPAKNSSVRAEIHTRLKKAKDQKTTESKSHDVGSFGIQDMLVPYGVGILMTFAAVAVIKYIFY